MQYLKMTLLGKIVTAKCCVKWALIVDICQWRRLKKEALLIKYRWQPFPSYETSNIFILNNESDFFLKMKIFEMEITFSSFKRMSNSEMALMKWYSWTSESLRLEEEVLKVWKLIRKMKDKWVEMKVLQFSAEEYPC